MAAMPLLIKEDSFKTTYTKHDQLFKELINTFIKEFLEVFFPDVHDNIDLQAIKPIRDEVYTDMIEGSTRRLDIVVETTLKGKDVAVIVHIEPQSYKQDDFHERMYHYFSLLYNKYQKAIISIAVLSYEEKLEEKKYAMGIPFLIVLSLFLNSMCLRVTNIRRCS